MEKMKKLVYLDKPVIHKRDDVAETTFVLRGLERGFGNTLAVPLRRTLLSTISSLAPFAVKIEGVDHEFQTIKDVTEDVITLLMNLRKVRFAYNPNIVKDNEIVKVTLQSETSGEVTSRSLKVVSHPGVQVIDTNIKLATVMNVKALNVEIYLRSGRGFVSFDENKAYISKRKKDDLAPMSDIKKGEFIAVDSNFSPIKKVYYNIKEMNSASNRIEEELEFNIETDGTVDAKDALRQAADILIGLLEVIGDTDKMKVDIFEEIVEKPEEKQEDDIDISQMNLSVRSANALRKIKKTKLSQIRELTVSQLEQTKNLGRKSIQEIIDKVKDYGFELKEGDE
ncbi:DNA-directed RNA polymerase subunit alpha [Mycoplasma sp. 888]|uniref:DNA-directed RNA polymerase subunit alpha n=1 Tax=Mycoplasma sp. 888 TaxID=3108483 RepID=UPI002D776AF3|nr:DNA-directed RNA polymerase subunit alpha [Mycoplasma sp. 888]WRQ25861.1 DNA-directed RNA polymerase subunit alpha [Mycoplasma sp. 888]